MKKNLTLLFIFFISLQSSFAQDLGKVTIEELQRKQSTIDTSAAAEVIFKTASSYFHSDPTYGYINVLETSTKIKVYKKEGFNYANVVIPYFNDRNKTETVSVSSAVTYNLVNGQIEKTKMRSSEEFTVKENDNWKTKKFVLPNVKEGSIIEYKTKMTTPFISNLNTFKFQYNIPVLYASYKFTAPENIKYQHFIKGYVTVDVKNNSDNYTYTAKNVKPIKDESYVNNIDNFTSSLRLELSSYKKNDGMIQPLSDTWKSLVKKIYDGEFGTELNRTRYFGNDLAAIIKDKETRDDKINAIFNYVQNNIKWNNKRGYNPDLGVREAYKTKTGNVADINLILVAMLREAGLSASPILLSTRDNEVALFPSHAAFNYVIAAVEIQDDLILLDATSKNSKPNVLPIRALNWVGNIIRNNGSYTQVDMIPSSISNVSNMYTINLFENGSIEGLLRSRKTNYSAFNYREMNGLLNKESIVKSIQNSYPTMEIEDFDVKNLQNKEEDISYSYKFKVPNVADVIGDQIFFEPSFIFGLNKNPFTDEERLYPVDFIYGVKETDMYVITIPNGYEIEYLPKSVSFKTANNKFALKWVINADKNKISLRISEDINYPLISADEYQDLKVIFDEYVKVENEKIVLKKIK